MTSVITGIYGQPLHECVACGSQRIGFWRKKSFQYTASREHEEFHIYRCEHCGSGFLNQPPGSDWLKEIYQYSGQALTKPVGLAEIMAREAAFPNCTVDAFAMAEQARQLDQTGNGRALDIGSGFGFYTQALRRQGYATVSINPGRYENQVFREMNGDEPLPLMFESYQDRQAFGVVVMSQVLEHMLEPERAIEKVAGLLEPGGVLACAVPNYASFLVKLLGTRDNACLWVPEHVNFFTEQGLRVLLERGGFTVVKTEHVTRVPFDAISRRLGLTGRAAKLADAVVKNLQAPFARLMNALGMGIYLHVYALKQAG